MTRRMVKIRTFEQLNAKERKFIAGLVKYRPLWYILVYADGELVSHVVLTKRTMLVGDRPVEVGIVGGVRTQERWQRQGMASEAIRVAVAFICNRLQVNYSILNTYEDIVPFYTRLGWKMVKGPMMLDKAGKKTQHDGITLVFECNEYRWPDGLIEFGTPF